MKNRLKFKRCANRVRRAGMTFVEVMVWIGVLTLLLSSMTLAIIHVYRSNSYIFERASSVLSARKGLENVMKLIREAQYGDAGSYPVEAIGPNSFTFYADNDNDDSVERIRIFLDGSDLKMGVIQAIGFPAEYNGPETVHTIARNIRNVDLGVDLFTYYDSSGNQVVDMNNVTKPVFVKARLISNTGKDANVDNYELEASAYMRNLKNK